jgi:hypothetical protein
MLPESRALDHAGRLATKWRHDHSHEHMIPKRQHYVRVWYLPRPGPARLTRVQARQEAPESFRIAATDFPGGGGTKNMEEKCTTGFEVRV